MVSGTTSRALNTEPNASATVGVPGALWIRKLKWLEPRHIRNVANRRGRDHTDDLQYAFLTGVGFESWENIWGIWNQMTPRDAEALRRVNRIERNFAALLVSKDWLPHHPTFQYGIYASMFPGDGQTLWTLLRCLERRRSEAGGRRSIRRPLVSARSHGFSAVLAVDAGAAPIVPLLQQMKE
jgi:iron(II)-dependent oxidoreductase